MDGACFDPHFLCFLALLGSSSFAPGLSLNHLNDARPSFHSLPFVSSISFSFHLSLTQAFCGDECVGAVVAKLEKHRDKDRRGRGYIAMLAVSPAHRGKVSPFSLLFLFPSLSFVELTYILVT